MGSWQPRGAKSFMWIRDELPDLLTGVRFIIYGYDTKLYQSKSFQVLPDLARSFIASLQASGWVSKPLLFLAHSLGGVLMKVYCCIKRKPERPRNPRCHERGYLFRRAQCRYVRRGYLQDAGRATQYGTS